MESSAGSASCFALRSPRLSGLSRVLCRNRKIQEQFVDFRLRYDGIRYVKLNCRPLRSLTSLGERFGVMVKQSSKVVYFGDARLGW